MHGSFHILFYTPKFDRFAKNMKGFIQKEKKRLMGHVRACDKDGTKVRFFNVASFLFTRISCSSRDI